MWINTNNGIIAMGNQSVVNGGSAATGITMGSSTTVTAYLNVHSTKTYSVTDYGYYAQNSYGNTDGNSGNAAYSIYSAGRIQAAEFDATSDERLKDIQGSIPLEQALQFVKAVDGILYTWKPGHGDDGLKSGFGAQSVVKAGFKHMVGAIANDKVEGRTDPDGFVHPDKTQLTINYSEAVPYHHEVIKHLLDRIEQLEATVAKLAK